MLRQCARAFDLAAGVVGIGLLVLASWTLVLAWPFTTDDAYITLRYAAHLAHGHGIVWNPGEAPPIEGYSNLLLVLYGALAIVLGLEPIVACKVLGVLSLLAVIVLLVKWLVPHAGWGWTWAAVGWFAASAGATQWAVSGLETLLYAAVVVALAWWLDRRHSLHGGDLLFFVALCTAAVLVRPDGVIAASVATWIAWQRAQPGERRFLFAWLPLLVVYVGWKAWYFAELLPNAALCKIGGQGGSVALLRDYWRAVWPLLPWVAQVGAVPAFVERNKMAYVLGLPLVYLALMVDVDPVIGQWQRHVLAVLPLLAGAAAVGAGRNDGSKGIRVLTKIAALAALLAFANDRLHAAPAIAEHAHRYAARMDQRAALAAYLERLLPAGGSLLLGDVGIVGYALAGKVAIIDAFCLNNRDFPRPPINRDPGRFVDHVLQSEPDAIVVHSRAHDRLLARPAYGIYPTLVERERFRRHYTRTLSFGVPGDAYHYWVFVRQDAQMSHPHATDHQAIDNPATDDPAKSQLGHPAANHPAMSHSVALSDEN